MHLLSLGVSGNVQQTSTCGREMTLIATARNLVQMLPGVAPSSCHTITCRSGSAAGTLVVMLLRPNKFHHQNLVHLSNNSRVSICFSNARCAVSLGSHVAPQGPQMAPEWRGQTLCSTSVASPQSAVGRRTLLPMLPTASWKQNWIGRRTCTANIIRMNKY